MQIQRNPKIGQLDIAVLGGENIGSFQVAMNNMGSVEIVQTLENLSDVGGY